MIQCPVISYALLEHHTTDSLDLSENFSELSLQKEITAQGLNRTVVRPGCHTDFGFEGLRVDKAPAQLQKVNTLNDTSNYYEK